MTEPQTFRVWDPDNGPECDGSDIEADTIRGAAEFHTRTHEDDR